MTTLFGFQYLVPGQKDASAGGMVKRNASIDEKAMYSRLTTIPHLLRAYRFQLDIKATITHPSTLQLIPVKILLDCGATGSTIDYEFIQKHQIPTNTLSKI